MILVELVGVAIDAAYDHRPVDLVQRVEHRLVALGSLRGDEVEVEADGGGLHRRDCAQEPRVIVARDGRDDVALEGCRIEKDEDDARMLVRGTVGQQHRAPVGRPVFDLVELRAQRLIEESERRHGRRDAGEQGIGREFARSLLLG